MEEKTENIIINMYQDREAKEQNWERNMKNTCKKIKEKQNN